MGEIEVLKCLPLLGIHENCTKYQTMQMFYHATSNLPPSSAKEIITKYVIDIRHGNIVMKNVTNKNVKNVLPVPSCHEIQASYKSEQGICHPF